MPLKATLLIATCATNTSQALPVLDTPLADDECCRLVILSGVGSLGATMTPYVVPDGDVHTHFVSDDEGHLIGVRSTGQNAVYGLQLDPPSLHRRLEALHHSKASPWARLDGGVDDGGCRRDAYILWNEKHKDCKASIIGAHLRVACLMPSPEVAFVGDALEAVGLSAAYGDRVIAYTMQILKQNFGAFNSLDLFCDGATCAWPSGIEVSPGVLKRVVDSRLTSVAMLRKLVAAIKNHKCFPVEAKAMVHLPFGARNSESVFASMDRSKMGMMGGRLNGACHAYGSDVLYSHPDVDMQMVNVSPAYTNPMAFLSEEQIALGQDNLGFLLLVLWMVKGLDSVKGGLSTVPLSPEFSVGDAGLFGGVKEVHGSPTAFTYC